MSIPDLCFWIYAQGVVIAACLFAFGRVEPVDDAEEIPMSVAEMILLWPVFLLAWALRAGWK